MLFLPVPHERLRRELGLGDELARIGATAKVPCVAAAIGDPKWQRVVVITGDTRAFTTAEDTILATEVAQRAAVGLELPLHVLVPQDTERPILELEATFGSYEFRAGSTFDHLMGGDLVVVPGHVIADAGFVDRDRVRAGLTHLSMLVVADTGRLASTRPPLYPLTGTISSTR